jgi:hypothetical protein
MTYGLLSSHCIKHRRILETGLRPHWVCNVSVMWAQKWAHPVAQCRACVRNQCVYTSPVNGHFVERVHVETKSNLCITPNHVLHVNHNIHSNSAYTLGSSERAWVCPPAPKEKGIETSLLCPRTMSSSVMYYQVCPTIIKYRTSPPPPPPHTPP